jgi:hypothetical protein
MHPCIRSECHQFLGFDLPGLLDAAMDAERREANRSHANTGKESSLVNRCRAACTRSSVIALATLGLLSSRS